MTGLRRDALQLSILLYRVAGALARWAVRS